MATPSPSPRPSHGGGSSLDSPVSAATPTAAEDSSRRTAIGGDLSSAADSGARTNSGTVFGSGTSASATVVVAAAVYTGISIEAPTSGTRHTANARPTPTNSFLRALGARDSPSHVQQLYMRRERSADNRVQRSLSVSHPLVSPTRALPPASMGSTLGLRDAIDVHSEAIGRDETPHDSLNNVSNTTTGTSSGAQKSSLCSEELALLPGRHIGSSSGGAPFHRSGASASRISLAPPHTKSTSVSTDNSHSASHERSGCSAPAVRMTSPGDVARALYSYVADAKLGNGISGVGGDDDSDGTPLPVRMHSLDVANSDAGGGSARGEQASAQDCTVSGMGLYFGGVRVDNTFTVRVTVTLLVVLHMLFQFPIGTRTQAIML